ncbi:MAG: hypothetical protein ACE3L7_24085 [Candidatus Pristimantibacillus sp.]
MLTKRLAVMLFAICMLFAYNPISYAETAMEEPFKPVQVFDVKAGKVIKSVPNDKEFQEQANSWLGSITNLAPQLKNDESCSYVYRIPLEKPVTIAITGNRIAAQDVFLFNCADKPPLLLVFDEQRKPYLFQFKADIKPFIKKIGIPAS